MQDQENRPDTKPDNPPPFRPKIKGPDFEEGIPHAAQIPFNDESEKMK